MKSVGALCRSPITACVLISTIVFLGLIGLRSTGGLESLELTAYDWYIRLQPKASALESPIVLIEISESYIRSQGRWPLPDATLARALDILDQYHPRAIGLDIYRDMPVRPGSEELDAILVRNPNIIAAMKFGGPGEIGVPSPPVLRGTDKVGFNDILVDRGGIVRRGLLFLDDEKNVSYSFALRLALLYLQAEGVRPQSDPTNLQQIRLGKTTIPPLGPNDGGYIGADARGYQFLLDFKDAGGPLTSFSLATLLSGEIKPEAIRGKIVIIGTTAEGVKDFFYFPHSRGLHLKQQIPGIVLHAYIASQLLRLALEGGAPMASMSDRQEWAWILLWSLMGGAMGLGVRSPWRFSLLALGGLLTLALAVYFAFLSGWWIPLVPPAMVWGISATVNAVYMSNREKGERASLMHLFSRHVSPQVAEAIWRQREQFSDGGRPRPQKLIETVMFTDLKGFTSLTEKMDPQALIEWLNIYLEATAQLVMEHGGVIDEYLGDGFKADFGIPVPRTEESEIGQDAVNAVNCALGMEKEIKRLNAFWQEHNLPTANMRIGIFTGPVVAGSLGSARRLKYTTIGDTVNIASRLEGFDKDSMGPSPTNSPCRILIGEATLHYLGNQFRTEKVGEVILKGKAQQVTIHHLIGRVDGQPGGA